MLIASRTPSATSEHAVHFEEFYRSQADRVYRALALTLANDALAREAADEAMARAFVHWGRISRYEDPGGWVYRVGLNWATSFWRRFGRELPTDELHTHELHIHELHIHRPPAGGSPRRSAPADEHSHAASLVAGLPRAQRAVVVCRVYLELTTAETATALNIPEGTVKSRLARALATLRNAMEEGRQDG